MCNSRGLILHILYKLSQRHGFMCSSNKKKKLGHTAEVFSSEDCVLRAVVTMWPYQEDIRAPWGPCLPAVLAVEPVPLGDYLAVPPVWVCDYDEGSANDNELRDWEPAEVSPHKLIEAIVGILVVVGRRSQRSNSIATADIVTQWWRKT